MKFIEVDIGGTLVHQMAVRSECYTSCGRDTKYYNNGIENDPALVVTCLRRIASEQPSAVQPTHTRRRPARL